LVTGLLLLACLVSVAPAQHAGWHFPLSDGIYGFRFGMSESDVRARAGELEMKPLPARSNTLRYSRSIRGQEAEFVFSFPEERPELYRILVRFFEMEGTPPEIREFFDYFDAALRSRYDEPTHATDADLADVLSAYRKVFHVYEGAETEAQIRFWAFAPGELRIDLMLDCPHLRPTKGRP